MSKATELAIKEKKNRFYCFLLVLIGAWCIRLQKEVLKTPEFAKWALENVVLVELDFPRSTPQDPNLKAQNQQLMQMFQVQGFPTLYFVSPTKPTIIK